MQTVSWILAQMAEPPLVSPSWLDRFSGKDLILLAPLTLGLVVVLLAFSFTLIDKIHRRNADTTLKREMIDRGMSADEIERVLAAKSSDGKK